MAGSATKRVPATAIDANDSTAQEELRSLRFDNGGRAFRYINTPSAIALGNVVGWMSATAAGIGSARVSPTRARTPARKAAGIAVGTITASYFGWIQVGGPVGTLQGITTRISTTAGGVLTGAPLVFTTNKIASSMAGGVEHAVFGFALRTSSGSIITSAHIDCL